MSKPVKCHLVFALTGLLLGVPRLSAQTTIVGAQLPAATELQAIVTGLRKVATEERLELGMNRICRLDVTHPDCPRELQATSFKGRLPGKVWAKARNILNADEQVGKQHSSLLKATFVYVQRPVAVGDSIVMLVQMLRHIEGAPRELLFFDVVLRGDSAHMEIVRTSQRADQPVK